MDKIIWKALFTLLLILPLGCDLGNDCGDFEQAFTNITGLEGRNVRLIEDGYSIAEALLEGSDVLYDRYGIYVTPTWELISQRSDGSHQGWFPVAYACSPPPPLPSEFIADIAVFSSTDYTQAGSSRVISAGDTLNAAFTIYDYYSGRIVGLTDFLMDEGIEASDQGFILQPAAAPAEAQQHAFTVHYRLENGEFYEISLPPLELLP